MTCSPSSFRAWENAQPAGAWVPGLNRRPGSPNAVASTVRSRRRGTGTRPGRRSRSSSRSAPGHTGARPALPAAPGRSRHRRAVLPAARPGPARPAIPSRIPAPTRRGRPPASAKASSCGSTGGVDGATASMADSAGNKAPGRRNGRRQPPSYQELCSISGIPCGVAAPRSTRHRTITITGKPDSQPYIPGNLRAVGLWLAARSSARMWGSPTAYADLADFRIIASDPSPPARGRAERPDLQDSSEEHGRSRRPRRRVRVRVATATRPRTIIDIGLMDRRRSQRCPVSRLGRSHPQAGPHARHGDPTYLIAADARVLWSKGDA